jgi:SpoVK/Ycf46/Vps4 family AAA+-type ATPase
LNFTDEQLLICGSRIPTYFLIPKHWRIIDVTGLRDVTFNTYAFDRLVIPQEQKDLISSLIPPPGVETAPFDDLIEGKGKGLIFLLHGPPGVGKTFYGKMIDILMEN